jgi:hypothetical protein
MGREARAEREAHRARWQAEREREELEQARRDAEWRDWSQFASEETHRTGISEAAHTHAARYLWRILRPPVDIVHDIEAVLFLGSATGRTQYRRPVNFDVRIYHDRDVMRQTMEFRLGVSVSDEILNDYASGREALENVFGDRANGLSTCDRLRILADFIEGNRPPTAEQARRQAYRDAHYAYGASPVRTLQDYLSPDYAAPEVAVENVQRPDPTVPQPKGKRVMDL